MRPDSSTNYKIPDPPKFVQLFHNRNCFINPKDKTQTTYFYLWWWSIAYDSYLSKLLLSLQSRFFIPFLFRTICTPPAGCPPLLGPCPHACHLACGQLSPSLRPARCSHCILAVGCLLCSYHRLPGAVRT